MPDEREEDSGLADFGSAIAGIAVALITFFVLSISLSAGWAVVAGLVIGAVFSWTTWWTIIHWTSARRDI